MICFRTKSYFKGHENNTFIVFLCLGQEHCSGTLTQNSGYKDVNKNIILHDFRSHV